MSDRYSKPILRKSVQRARELLQQRALELVEEFQDTIVEARADKQYEFALKAQQWLIEHIVDEDGGRIVGSSVDKIKEETKNTGPQVNIGIALGGVPQQVLPAPNGPVPILEAKVEPDHSLPSPASKPSNKES